MPKNFPGTAPKSRIWLSLFSLCVQYSLSSDRKRINKLIEDAIRMAENGGARVISLGTLNKVSSESWSADHEHTYAQFQTFQKTKLNNNKFWNVFKYFNNSYGDHLLR